MRFRVCLAILAVSFIIPCSAQFTSGTRPETADSNKRYTLSGTVVNSVTGEPIRRALVTLSYQQQLSAMTDSDGRFEFPDLPRAQMSVTAQKPGFFNEMELLAGGQRPKQYNVGPDAPSPVIKLMPEAIISGRIFDPDGLPIPRLLVRAVTQKVVQGRKEWQQGITARTDADGYYRIINLMPGSYFLTAGPGRAQAIVTGADETLDLGYPAVTYPAGATPMKL